MTPPDDGIAAFRIAVRTESDGFVRAYFARPDSFEGAVCIASISARLLQLDDALFDHFKELMRLAAGVMTVEGFGVAPARCVEQPPREGKMP